MAFNNKDLFLTHITCQLKADEVSATALFNSAVFQIFSLYKDHAEEAAMTWKMIFFWHRKRIRVV